ncbi:InlB B-repeat-containing protein [Gordonibacter sp. 28C]|uniref:InlB B-repeat-containing protein n=1 Tax=Gordonibacter sp. 28C TaxID=2078569 RepID=UPI0011C021E1|nr:InlB B-repeat-containing protein [Gordonibacter sp. 28C]
MTPKLLRVLCAFALTVALVPVGALSALADEGSERSEETVSDGTEQSALAMSGIEAAALRFTEVDPDEGLTAGEQTRVPDYYQVLNRADRPEQAYTLYYYTVNGGDFYRVYGSVDGQNVGYYAYEIYSGTVDMSHKIDNAEERATTAAEAARLAAEKAAAQTPPPVEAMQPEADISEDADVEVPEAVPFSDDVSPLAGTDYTPDSPNFKVEVTNLGMTPNAGIWPGDRCELAFNWNVAFSGVQNSFKNGDTVTIPTNLADLYRFAGGWTSNVATAGGTVVATLTLTADGKIVIAFNQAAEDMGFVGLYGTFPGYFEKFAAKNLDLSADSNEALTVASETVSLGFKGGKLLNVTSVGNGSASLSGGAVSVLLNSGSSEITGTPNVGETLKSVTLTKADGTKQAIAADASGKVVIGSSDLQNGKNTVTYEFSTNTTPPSTDVLSEWTWDNKAYWGSDAPTGSTLLTSAHFNVQFNYQSMLGLYQSGGTNLNHFKEDGTVSNAFFEDTVPGGSNVKAICGDRNGNGKPKIWATLYDVTTATVDAHTNNPNPTTTPTTKVLKNVDLVANGTISEVVQGAGESLGSFRSRVQAAPLTYGVHTDPATGAMTLMVNLGSPGTPGSGVNATATWGDAVTSNATLSAIYGDGNVVGGNVQAFQIEYYADYAGTPYPLSGLTNAVEYTRTNAQGSTSTSTIASSAYSVPGNTVVAVPSKGELRITKVDVLTHAPIQGAVFKVQIQGSDGAWSDYRDSLGNVVQGTTGVDGKVLLGAMTSNSTYRAVEVSVPAPYASDSLAFTHIGGIAISSTGEFSMSSSDVEGCEALATNQKAFTVTYDANGGSGTMTDPDSPYAEGAAWAPLGNAFTYAHHHFVGWNTEANGTGQAYNVGQTYNISQDVTLYAQWAVDAHSVSYVSSDTDKGVVAGGPETVDHGSNPTMTGVTVTPNTGFELASPAWSYSMAKGDGSFKSDTTNDPSSVAITGDTVFMALFKEKANVPLAYASINASMGTVSPQSESLAPVTGTAAGSTATALPGYHFVKWTNDVDATETADATLTGAQVDAVAKTSGIYVPVTFTAHFAEDADVTISYVSGDSSMGSVLPISELVHPATGAALGSTATAAPGYHFVKWTNNVNSAETTDAWLTGSQVDAVAKTSGVYVPVTFTAHFAPNANIELTYVSDSAAAGSVSPASESLAPATGSASGSTAAAKPGYHFVSWTNNLDSTVTTDAVLSAAQVDAVAKSSGIYEPVTFTAHFAENANIGLVYASNDSTMGGVSPSGEALAPATGAASGSTATANPGYHFVKWTNDVDATETTDATLSPAQVDAVAKSSGIYEAATFTAHFEKDPSTVVEVTKSVDKDVAKPGDILTYTIHVANKGGYKSDGIFVKDIIPANTTFVGCDERGIYGTTGSSENYVKWWIGEGLPSGTSLDLTLKVRVNECRDGTEIANVALWQETATRPDTPAAENQVSGTNKVKTTVNGSRPPALGKMVKTGDGLLKGGAALLVLAAAVGGAGLLLARRHAAENRR